MKDHTHKRCHCGNLLAPGMLTLSKGCGEWTSSFLPSPPAKRRTKVRGKQWTGKQRREGLMNQHPQTWPSEQPQRASAQPKPSRTQGEALPQPLEATEGRECAASLSPRKRGTMPAYPDTLGRSAWLQGGFRETTLSPSRTQSQKIPAFPKQPGEKQHKGFISQIPQKHGWARQRPLGFTRAPQAGSRAAGDPALAPRSAPRVPVVPKSWSPPSKGC